MMKMNILSLLSLAALCASMLPSCTLSPGNTTPIKAESKIGSSNLGTSTDPRVHQAANQLKSLYGAN